MRAFLPSFDGTESVRGEILRPDRYNQLFLALRGETPSIPRGSGLSYCNASAAPGTRSISSLAFDRILHFDDETGRIVVEPGIRVGALLRFVAARGWYLPVVPGHPEITVGGCIGFDVHGKSHYHGGSFSRWVEELVIFHPDHGELRCSRQTEPDLFFLTLGGFGLTGFVTSAALRLGKMPQGTHVVRRRIAVKNLLETLDSMESHGSTASSLYSWNDLTRSGPAFGKGFVYVEHLDRGGDRPSSDELFRRLDPTRRAPWRLPLWNRLTTPPVNRCYSSWQALGSKAVLDVSSAAFPINGKESYYALFGSRGLREYQMLVPRSAWSFIVQSLESLLRRAKISPTLGSTKLFAGSSRFLNFSGSGICLTLDVPATPPALLLFRELDRLVIEAKGIVNISKDSRLSRRVVERMFPHYASFRSKLLGYDPNARFDSMLRRRLLG
jgi:decaprenylphospho-beta-D-ribofuranose 2-oxidase